MKLQENDWKYKMSDSISYDSAIESLQYARTLSNNNYGQNIQQNSDFIQAQLERYKNDTQLKNRLMDFVIYFSCF